MYHTLDADWHWARYEYQSRRRRIHSHGTAKLKNDFGPCDLTETALQGFLAEQKLNKSGSKLSDSERVQLNLQVTNGKQASGTVCQYVDWLVTSVNPHTPDEEIGLSLQCIPAKESTQKLMTFIQIM